MIGDHRPMSELPRPQDRRTLDRLAEVRQLGPDELPALRHLHLSAFKRAAGEFLTQKELRSADDWIHGQAMFDETVVAAMHQQIFGAWIDRTLVAVAAWTEERSPSASARLRWVAADPMFERCGLGRRVVVHTEFAATTAGHTRLAVRALPGTSGFFQRLGYFELARGLQPLTASLQVPAVYLVKEMRHPAVDPSVRH
jgi:GNAT superfamily N-acetyltransferase